MEIKKPAPEMELARNEKARWKQAFVTTISV